MEALRLNEYITGRDLTIVSDKLLQFKDKRVEIIILPAENPIEGKDFMSFAGSLSEEDGNSMLKDLDACRKIDEENW